MKPEKRTYNEWIDLLRSHTFEAPDQWVVIEDDLELSDVTQMMLEYQPDEKVWDNIETSLDHNKYRKGSLLWMIFILFGLISIYTAFNIQTTQEKIEEQQFAYTSNIEYQTTTESTSNPSDLSLNEATSFIESNAFLFTDQQIESYKKELDDIMKALEELNTIKENYGSDSKLEKQTAQLERTKAKLLKSMINRT